MTDAPHSKYGHLYAVLRFHFPVNTEYPENSVSVVKVFPSKLDGDKEVDRLNKINADKHCRYVLTTTRLVPPSN